MLPIEVISKFNEKKILVMGDAGLDRYSHGYCARLCPEAPVPIFVPTKTECRAGLAGNVATNIAALGATVKLCTIIGDDQDGVDLTSVLSSAGVFGVEKYVCTDSSRRTTVKTRYVSDWHLMLRVDEEVTHPFEEEMMDRFLTGALREAWIWADAVVVQDYGKGIVTQKMMKELSKCRLARKIPVVVDPSPRQNPHIYKGASILKPNIKEMEAMKMALGITSEFGVIETLGLDALLITLGPDGMMLWEGFDGSGISGTKIDAIRRDVHDVCGAGDTVTAVLALSLASGLSYSDSAEIANTAASIAVSKFGTSTVPKDELIEILRDRGVEW